MRFMNFSLLLFPAFLSISDIGCEIKKKQKTDIKSSASKEKLVIHPFLAGLPAYMHSFWFKTGV